MNPLVNNVFNGINDLQQPVNPNTQKAQGFFKRHVLTRAAEVIAGAPSEIAAVAVNALYIPVYAAGAVLNLALRVLSRISSSEAIRTLRSRLPDISDFLKTVAYTVGYAIGVFSTLSLGVLSPSANFKLHCAFVLTRNRRELDPRLVVIEEKVKEAQEKERIAEENLANAEEIQLKAEQTDDELEEMNRISKAFEVVEGLQTKVEETAATAGTTVKEVVSSTVSNVENILPKVEDDVLLEEVELDNRMQDLEEEIIVEEKPKRFTFLKNLGGAVKDGFLHPINTTKKVLHIVTFGYFKKEKVAA